MFYPNNKLRACVVQDRLWDILRDIPDLSYVQPEGNYYFKTSDSYQILKSCSINISDCLKSPGTCDSSPCITTCKIKTDKNNTCKTCVMLITSPEFTSNLTGKTYYTKSFEPLDCSTKNVIYGIECTLCGLLYVGETRQTLRSRMNQHRYDAKDPKYRILYNHFNQPGHDRCLTMKVRIIEKIYHHTNSPILSTPYRTDRELFWIKELGTAMPYGCNDNIKGVGNLSSPGYNEINVMSLLILFQELNVAMVIKQFNILMLKSPLNQERYKILLMIYFLIYRNLLEFIIFVQSYLHYL